jgi:hypothetical protein
MLYQLVFRAHAASKQRRAAARAFEELDSKTPLVGSQALPVNSAPQEAPVERAGWE